MKKIVVLFISLFLITGCQSLDINKVDNDELVDMILNEEKAKPNTFLQGYKMYLPPHISLIGDLNNNNILYSNGNKYYLYVDLVSYYNKESNVYDFDKDDYVYSKEIDFNGKPGYIMVNKSKGGYLVETMYNYAKIEVITRNIKRAIADSLIVLKNIKFDYKIIDSMIGTNALVYDAETFTLLGPKKSKDNFLTYEEEYGVYNEDDYKDDKSVIEIESVD